MNLFLLIDGAFYFVLGVLEENLDLFLFEVRVKIRPINFVLKEKLF